MGIFDRFPYSSTHEMNLDFMLGKATEIAEDMQQVTAGMAQVQAGLSAISEKTEQATQAAAQAAASASSIEGSVTAAEEAAEEAQTHNESAQTWANNALTYKADCQRAATEAAASSSSAAQAATAAAASEDTVATYAQAANASAQSAANNNDSAHQYANQASASASNATFHSSNAQTAATNAQTAATNANTSATNAAASADRAATLKTDVETLHRMCTTAVDLAAEQAVAAANSAAQAAATKTDVENLVESLPEDFTDLNNTVNQLSDDIVDVKNEITQLKSNVYNQFVNHVSDPFIKTNIVLVGDSITAGMGGTGYSPTDETIIGSAQKSNVKDAVCWGNMLYHYLLNNYGGENTVDFSNPKITIASSGVNTLGFNITKGNQAINYLAAYSGNSVSQKIINFDFYGESFSILYSKSAIYGIFDVYIDGVLNTSVDCYDTTTTHGVSIAIGGLTKGTHTVEIYSTNNKNASSNGYGFYIIAFVLNKEIEYHNYGISGSTTNAGYNTDGRYTSDMDFAFVMYGTNNRVTTGTYLRLSSELIGLCDLLIDTYGITPILMCATPIAEGQDTSGTTNYAFHMNDVERAVAATAAHYSSPFIDNYDWFLEYSELKGIDFTTLLVDGLHPNDTGYYVLYRNVIKTLGLPLLPEYREWWHPST